MPQYLSTDPYAGQTAEAPTGAPQYLSTDPHAGEAATTQPTSAPASAPRTWLDSAGDFVGESLAWLNPKNINRAVQSVNPATFDPTAPDIVGGSSPYSTAANAFGRWTPVATARKVLQAQGELAQKAGESVGKGNYVEAGRHAAAYALPFLGPRLDEAGDLMQRGETAKGLGATVDVASQLFGPKAIKTATLPKVPVRPVAPAPTLAEALATRGTSLAERLGPKATTPETAARSVTRGLTEKTQALHDEASSQYAALREMEADPRRAGSVTPITAGQSELPAGSTTTFPIGRSIGKRVGLAVSVDDVNRGLQPLYARLAADNQVAPLMGKKARALRVLTAMREIDGPVPLSQADAWASELKTVLRGSQSSALPFLRDAGAGATAQIVAKLDRQILDTAANAGPDVLQALKQGREATRAKYDVAATLKPLPKEPVKSYARLVQRGDKSVEQLAKVAEHAPEAMPEIGRAWLDDTLSTTASGKGLADRGKTIASNWDALGDRTKALLFRDKQYIADLDTFFGEVRQLGEKTAETRRIAEATEAAKASSVTRVVATYAGDLVLHKVAGPATMPIKLTWPVVQRLLSSPSGARALARGLKTRLSDTAAASSVASELARFAGESWPAASPAGAGTQRDKARRSQ